jgi:hypothetical protein
MRALLPLLLACTSAGCAVDENVILGGLPPPLSAPEETPTPAATENPLASAAFPYLQAAQYPLAESAPDNGLNRIAWGMDRELTDDFTATLQDHFDYYAFDNLRLVALGIALAAPVANSTADVKIRNWYQDAVQGHPGLERWGVYICNGGDYTYTLPVYFGTVLAATALEALDDPDADRSLEGDLGALLDEWGRRSLRAMAVGAPPVGILLVVLGSPRPGTGVSGHAFVGSVPFVTAALMTDDPLMRSVLFLGSFVVAWARIQVDAHYFSQAALGWWMGYLAASRVSGAALDVETRSGRMQFIPCCSEGPGVSILLDY